MRQTGNTSHDAHKMSGIANAKPMQSPTGLALVKKAVR
jgi:hypothetical protein